MPLSIRPAVPSDAPILTEIYLSAFTHDAISRLVFPRGPATTAFWTNSILEEIQDPHAHFLCVVDAPPSTSAGTNATGSSSDQQEERLIAYAKWNAPSAPHPDPEDLPQWPEGADSELANSFFGTLMRKHAEVMGDRRHWYLEILATRVEDQGKGAGGLLIKWGCKFLSIHTSLRSWWEDTLISGPFRLIEALS
jgi:hypothetical protein